MGTTYTRLRRLDLKRRKIEKIAKGRKLKKIANRIKVSPLRPKQRESRSWSHSLSQSCSWRWPRTTIPSSRVGKEGSKQEWRCDFFWELSHTKWFFFYGSDFLRYSSRSDLLLDILKFTTYIKIRKIINMGTRYTRLRRLDLKWREMEKITKRRKLKKLAIRKKVSPLWPKPRKIVLKTEYFLFLLL